MELPIVPSCALDAEGMTRQRERYRAAGADARVLERSARRLSIQVAPGAAEVVPDLVEIERSCCSFFQIDWAPAERLLSVAVAEGRDEPALEAIAHALGI
jgi:hypothetical protein